MSTTETAIVPWTGEQIDIHNPADAALALERIKEFSPRLAEFRARCTQTLLDESARRGQLRFETGRYAIEVRGQGESVEYDLEKLAVLRDEGLPDERWAELVKLEPKVSAVVIKQLRRNPTYDKIIERAVKNRSPKHPYVSVKEA